MAQGILRPWSSGGFLPEGELPRRPDRCFLSSAAAKRQEKDNTGRILVLVPI